MVKYSVKLAKLQGWRIGQERERSKLVGFCVRHNLPLPEERSVVPSLMEILDMTRSYAKRLKQEAEKSKLERNQGYNRYKSQ